MARRVATRCAIVTLRVASSDLNPATTRRFASVFVAGFVTHPVLVPARDERELGILRDAARGAVLSGEASEWALATLHAGEREWLAIHLQAPLPLAAGLARRVKAPWMLDIDRKVEKNANGNRWPDGARLRFLDPEGGALATLAGDARFDEAPLPPIAAFETGAPHAREASARDLPMRL